MTTDYSMADSMMFDSVPAPFGSPGDSPKRDYQYTGSIGSSDASHMMTKPMVLDGQNQAPRACEKCRASKRKCDKRLPFCDRCKRLNAKCHYIQDPVANNPSPHGAQVVVFQPHSLSYDGLFQGSEPLEGVTAAQILSLISLGSPPSESSSDWRASVQMFFHCVYPWYAVVHPTLFNRRLANLTAASDTPSPPDSQSSPFSNGHSDRQVSAQANQSTDLASKEMALLIVAMYLTTRMRLTQSGEHYMFDETYRTVKRIFALLIVGCAGGPQPSIELIQTGALIALYEYGHGDLVSSYRTLSQTATVAHLLEIRAGQLSEEDGPNELVMSSLEEEQSGCLWWGLFLVEQFLHQDEGLRHLPFVMETPTRYTVLPETPSMTPLANSAGMRSNSLSVSAPHPSIVSPTSSRRLTTSVEVGTAKMGSFQLSAKVASLLHRSLLLDKERNLRPGKIPLVGTYADLDVEIRKTTHALIGQSLDWEVTLDCFAMLSSSLFMVYLPYLPILEVTPSSEVAVSNELRTALAALRFACKISTDITCKVNQDCDVQAALGATPSSTASSLASPDSSSSSSPRPLVLCAPAGATCYLVIVAFSKLCRIFPEERLQCQEAIAEKFESLRLFSYRWGIAEKMMSQLEQKIGIDRQHYFNRAASSLSPPPRSASMDLGH